MDRLKGKVALVTGGALGIGAATCKLFGSEGAKVAILDIDDQSGHALMEGINDIGGEASYWHLDVSQEGEVDKVFREVYEKWGHIDILVNNAAISGANAPTDRITTEEWNQVMNVNVNGVFLCTKYIIPYLREAGDGSIVNLSSIYGIISAPDVPPYHASKGAVREMSKTDALIYAKDNIRVNSVHPGFIWTPMVENYLKDQGGNLEEAKNSVGNLHPIGHMGEPDDIAYGMLYLASPESKFVTGTELVIDGGYIAQ